MQTFSFFYGLHLGILILSHSALAFRGQSYVQWMLNRMPSFLSVFFEVYDRTGMQAFIGPRSPKLLQSWSCHQGIWRVMLNLSTIPMQRTFTARSILKLHVDTVTSCIEECFNQKDYTMYANCELVLVKGALGKIVSQEVDQLCEFYTEFDPDTLRIQLSIMAESYHSFTHRLIHCTMSQIPRKEQKDLVHTRGHILGQDCSGYASNKCQL